MKRYASLFSFLMLAVVLMGADGCASDPNVEGAKLDLRNKDYDRALENLTTALEKNPDNASALDLKGQVLLEQVGNINDLDEHTAKVNEMLESFHRAMELDPSLSETIEQRLSLAYFNEFTKGIQAFNRGNQNDAPEEFGTAVSYFDIAATIRPDSAGTYVNKAFALIRADRAADAMEPLQVAIDKGENTADNFELLASLYLQNGRESEAVSLLESASQTYPDNNNLQAQLLNAYQLTGQMDRAMQAYQDAVDNNPEDKLYRYNFGSILLESKRYDEAIEHLQKATEIDPEYANAFYNWGAAYQNQAFDLTDEINAEDDALRANRDDLNDDEIKTREDKIQGLLDSRKALYEQSIPPLERARELTESQGEDSTPICNALFQAYAQMGDEAKYKEAAECAGIEI